MVQHHPPSRSAGSLQAACAVDQCHVSSFERPRSSLLARDCCWVQGATSADGQSTGAEQQVMPILVQHRWWFVSQAPTSALTSSAVTTILPHGLWPFHRYFKGTTWLESSPADLS